MFNIRLKFDYKLGYHYKINIITYFENLTIELYVFYILNTYAKFRANQMLFTI